MPVNVCTYCICSKIIYFVIKGRRFIKIQYMYYKTGINLWRRMPFSEEEKQPWTLHTFIFFWITMSDFQFNIHIKQSHVSFFVSQLSLKTYFTVYSCCVGHLLFWYGPGILLYNRNAEGLLYTNRTLQDFS